MTCHGCGKRFVQDEPINVVTAPLTPEERAEWWSTFGPQTMPLDWSVLVRIRQDAPYVQTYYFCRPCLQPMLHGGGSVTALREQYAR